MGSGALGSLKEIGPFDNISVSTDSIGATRVHLPSPRGFVGPKPT
jgi:hypothetical protein